MTAVKQDLKTAGIDEAKIKGVRLPQLSSPGNTEFIGETPPPPLKKPNKTYDLAPQNTNTY